MIRHILCFILGFAFAAGAIVWIAAGDPEWTLSRDVRFLMMLVGTVVGGVAVALSVDGAK